MSPTAENALNGVVCYRCGVYVVRVAKYVGNVVNELHYNNRALFEQLLVSSIVSGNAIEHTEHCAEGTFNPSSNTPEQILLSLRTTIT